MNKFEEILLTLLFIELFIGGGGRLIDFGLLSIRQVLFIILLLTFVYRIFKNKAFFNKEVNTFFRLTPVTIGVYLLIASFGVSSLIGIMNGHPLGIIVTDFFRVSYLVLFFPLAYYISKDRFSMQRIVKILKYSAIVVSIFTITVTLIGKTIFVSNFDQFYVFMNTIMNDDLFFRPSNSVFYKSHFYVLIGLILVFNDLLNKHYSKLNVTLVILGSISLIWSETRGFLLAFMLSALMIILLDVKIIVDPIKGLSSKIQKIIKSKFFIKKFIISLIVISSVPFLFNNMTLERFEVATGEENQQEVEKTETETSQQHSPFTKQKNNEVNDVSVNARMEFITDSISILSNPVNLIVGTGYGTEIADRITGIEMSFLDILIEQGLIGLAIWVFLFLIVYYNYYIAYKNGYKLSSLDVSLLSVFMGVLLLTNINPFINNPIGMSFFLLLLVVSQKKKEFSKKEVL